MTIRVMLSFRYTGEPEDKLRVEIPHIAHLIDNSSADCFCTYFMQEKFDREKLSNVEILRLAFTEIEKCDLILAYFSSQNKSEGMLLEIGYALSLKIPILMVKREGLQFSYLEQLSDYLVTFKSMSDLDSELAPLIHLAGREPVRGNSAQLPHSSSEFSEGQS